MIDSDVAPHPGLMKFDLEDGTLYEPSNGTEGEIFMSFFCEQCIKHPISSDAKSQCPILMKVFAYRRCDPKYPPQWHYKNGQPRCSSFKDRDEEYEKRRQRRRQQGVKPRKINVKNLDLFED